MNQKTAKLLRQYARMSDSPLKNIKRKWQSGTAKEKGALRLEMTSELWSTFVTEWRREMNLELKEVPGVIHVPEDTFKGWEYGKHIPPKFVRIALAPIMRKLLAVKANESHKP